MEGISVCEKLFRRQFRNAFRFLKETFPGRFGNVLIYTHMQAHPKHI